MCVRPITPAVRIVSQTTASTMTSRVLYVRYRDVICTSVVPWVVTLYIPVCGDAGQRADGRRRDRRLWREAENLERRSISLKNFASRFS